MNDYLNEALKKLEEGTKDPGGLKERVVAQPVAYCLSDFCRQDAEFAQAVAQGGSFADCLRAVLKDVGTAVSDIEAYRRAAGFYFPGCAVEMQMVIRVNPHEAEEQPAAEAEKPGGGIVLNLSDFF